MTITGECGECKGKLEDAMFRVITTNIDEDKLYINIPYCEQCEEYKGFSNVDVMDEMQIVMEHFQKVYERDLSDVIYYKCMIKVHDKGPRAFG